MRSSDPSEPLDLDRGLPTTASDVAILRGLRQPARLATEDYLRLLALLVPPSADALRARRGPRGAPFALPPDP